MSEFDLDLDDDNSDLESVHEKQDHESDEDTEDASETDMIIHEERNTEMKQFQSYQDNVANLKNQLQQLEEGKHPKFLNRLKELDQTYQDRLFFNEVFQKVELERVEKEYEVEKEAAVKEYDEKSVELRDNLIADLEEKLRVVEAERFTMELTGDSTDVKPLTTRQLRRRPNDPLPIPEKRRKTSPIQLRYLLDESEILEDLKIISKGKYKAPSRRHREVSVVTSASEHSSGLVEVRVEDGKLYYDKKWFHRGQPIYYEAKEGGCRNSGIICTISSSEIWIKRMSDCIKIRISVSQLQKGRYLIKRRSS